MFDKSTVMLGTSAAMRAIEREIDVAAGCSAKVLITGESGVGKELVARLIHEGSARRANKFVAINCAGLPDSLLESELFGHVRGSFTGAYRDKKGWLEAAHGGTIFLDEVGEMSLRMQAMLLRFLETGEIQRVGSERALPALDVRVIAATHRNSSECVRERTFREDLYYRLNVVHIEVPPLRDRRGDIPVLLKHFLSMFSSAHRLPVPEVCSRRHAAARQLRLAGQCARAEECGRASRRRLSIGPHRDDLASVGCLGSKHAERYRGRTSP